MRVKVISRSTDDYTRERSQDLQVGDPCRDCDSADTTVVVTRLLVVVEYNCMLSF